MTLLFQCRKCGLQAASLEGHRCVAAASDRLERARVVLSEASERVGAQVGKAAIHGQAFVKDGRVLKSEASAPAEKARFDRNAYHKAYMRTYMRGWRSRRRQAAKPI